jgi:hypothetical protein
MKATRLEDRISQSLVMDLMLELSQLPLLVLNAKSLKLQDMNLAALLKLALPHLISPMLMLVNMESPGTP